MVWPAVSGVLGGLSVLQYSLAQCTSAVDVPTQCKQLQMHGLQQCVEWFLVRLLRCVLAGVAGVLS
jgi:hypothetical protein